MQVTVAASAPPSLPAQEVSISPPTMVTTPVSLVAFFIAAPSTIVTPLLSAGVTTTNALEMPPPSSSASSIPPLAILASRDDQVDDAQRTHSTIQKRSSPIV